MIFSTVATIVMGEGWTPARLGDLNGTYFAITGGNSGIGLEAARQLGRKGARVAVLCRNRDKAEAALSDLKASAPAGRYDFVALDLADLRSVQRAVSQIGGETDRIDGLLCNAGLMALPSREVTADGFEMQFGVNFLGHFALAGQLAPMIEDTGGRFVTVSSIAHRRGRIRFDDLQSARFYHPWIAYAQSKLADLLFAQELHRRLRSKSAKAWSIACHPGVSPTNLVSTGMGAGLGFAYQSLGKMFLQPVERGAWPGVMAAAAAEVESGGYYGPTAPGEMVGPIGRAATARRARDPEVAARLWRAAEELTQVRWNMFD